MELMLVTVIVSLLASIGAPFVQAARDRAYVRSARSDLGYLQHAIKSYRERESAWPTSIVDLRNDDDFTSSDHVSVCYFIPIPAFSWRPASVLVMLAHERSSTMVYTLYPIYDGEVIEFKSSARGCTL